MARGKKVRPQTILQHEITFFRQFCTENCYVGRHFLHRPNIDNLVSFSDHINKSGVHLDKIIAAGYVSNQDYLRQVFLVVHYLL